MESTDQEGQAVMLLSVAAFLLVTLSEVRIGKMLLEIPKDTSFHGNQHSVVTSATVEITKPSHKPPKYIPEQKPKSEVIREAGFTPKRAERFQTLAARLLMGDTGEAGKKTTGQEICFTEICRTKTD